MSPDSNGPDWHPPLGQTQPTVPLPAEPGPPPPLPAAPPPAMPPAAPAPYGYGPGQTQVPGGPPMPPQPPAPPIPPYAQVPFPGPPPRKPMSRGAKRGLIGGLVGAGVLVLLIVGGAIALSLMNQARDPARLVEQYLALIADGRAEAANEMVDPGLSRQESALLTDEVLAAAEERIEVIAVETVGRSGRGAEVSAVLRLDGVRFEQTFSVEPGPKEWLLLDTWVLEDSLAAPVTIESYDSQLRSAFVGEQEVELEGVDGFAERTVYLYPGVYRISAPESRYLDASTEAVTVPVPGGRDDPIEIWAEQNRAFEDEIMRQAEEAAQHCITVPNNMAPECPFWLRRTDLTQMTVAEKPMSFDSLSLDYFDTARWYFGRTIDGDSLLAEDWYWLQGSIEWDEQGEPHIADWDFYDGYND